MAEKLSLTESWVCALAAVLPWLAVAASYALSQQLLLGTYFLIGSFVFVAVLRMDARSRDGLLMFVIWCLSVSLLMSAAMISDNLVGYDIHMEYHVFLQVLQSGKWAAQSTNLYNSVISISILPSAIALVSALDAVPIFRFVFPAIYSLLPVFLYKVYRKILTQRYAFLSVFLFMSFGLDGMISLAREEVAEVLLVVLLLILLSRKLSGRSLGTLAAMILTVGLVAAHYSIAYLYLFLVIFATVVSVVFRRRDVALCGSMIMLMTVITCLAWYAYVARGEAIAALSRNASIIAKGIVEDFFASSARPQAVVNAVGFTGMSGILHDMNRATLYLIQFFLILGFLGILLKRGKNEMERKMLPLMVVAFMFIGSAVVLPFFAATLQLSRIYHVALLFASPCLLYGVNVLDSLARLVVSHFDKISHVRIRTGFSAKSILTVGLLFSYFLFTSGWVWAVSVDRPTSLQLDFERFLTSPDVGLNAVYFDAYTVPKDIAAARWLLAYHSNSRTICADIIARYHVLNSYGEFERQGPTLPGCGHCAHCGYPNSYVFISEFNSLHGVGEASHKPPSYDRFAISEISTELSIMARIYSDGGATVYA